MKNYCVYIHIFPNNKVYIGITKQDLNRRWRCGKGYKNSNCINSAIKKYGWENIKHELLDQNSTREEATNYEQLYIKKYKSNERDYGYNRTSGGEWGYEHTEEHRIKMSKLHSGNNYCVGRKYSEETINKMSESAKKKIITEEHKRNLDLAHNKPVNQYTKDGVFVANYESATIYAKSIGKKSGNLISKHLGNSNKYKSAYGYIWKYSKKENEND